MASSTMASIALTVWKVCPPIILLLGTFGNSMTLTVIRASSPASGGTTQSIYVFFTALAVSDLVLLYAGLLRRWLQFMWKIDIRALHDVICKLDVFLVYVSGMTSSWFLVCMTVQRVLSIIWPLQVGLVCTRGKTQVIVAVTATVVALINWHFLANYAVINVNNSTSCMSDQSNIILHEYDETVFSWIDIILTSGLPASLLLFSNTVLVSTVVQSARGSSALAPGLGKTNDNREKAASALSVMLMSVSIAFLVLTLPSPMYMLVSHIVGPEWWGLYVAVTNMMWYLNSAINFYVYCLTGSKFRSQFKRLVSQWVCTYQKLKKPDCGGVSVVAQNTVIAEGSRPSRSSTVMSLQT